MKKLSEYPLDGKFGKYGGRFVPEVLMTAISELEEAYEEAKERFRFQKAAGLLPARVCWKTNVAVLR